MTVINCFSKFAFAVPLKSKNALAVESALRPILKQCPMKYFHTDQGTEWVNSKIKSLLLAHNVNHYYTYSDKKASIVERFNRTLKNMMWKMFSEQGTFKWNYKLADLVKKYNKTRHRTIGIKPVNVNILNERDVLLNIIKQRNNNKEYKQKFQIGDHVIISTMFKPMTKGYWPRWSNEIFTIERAQHTSPPTYILRDSRGTILKGGFYQEELSKTKYSDVYLIEKVIRRKGDKLLDRWLGFDKSHDSWVDKSEVQV